MLLKMFNYNFNYIFFYIQNKWLKYILSLPIYPSDVRYIKLYYCNVMTNSTKTTKISAAFLATVLVAGIFAISSPSFMVGAQAVPDYGMDSYDKKSHDKDPVYGMDSYDKKSYGSEPDYGTQYSSYGKDNNDKSKDSVDILKLKCKNTNINLNGISVNGNGDNGNGDNGDDLASASLNGNGERNNNFVKKFIGKDFDVVCISKNNNNNQGAGDDDEEPEPRPTCADCFSSERIGSVALTQIVSVLESIAPAGLPFLNIVIPTTSGNIVDLCLDFAAGLEADSREDAITEFVTVFGIDTASATILVDCLIEAEILEITVGGAL